MQTDMQTDRQTDRHADREADRQTDMQTDRQADRQTGRQACRQTDRQADRQADRQTDRQADRQTDMQTERQADRQAGRHAAGQADRQADDAQRPTKRQTKAESETVVGTGTTLNQFAGQVLRHLRSAQYKNMYGTVRRRMPVAEGGDGGVVRVRVLVGMALMVAMAGVCLLALVVAEAPPGLLPRSMVSVGMIDKFLKAQQQLDAAPSMSQRLKELMASNKAAGDRLAATMEGRGGAGTPGYGLNADVASAMKAADAAIREAGLSRRKSLLGRMRAKQVEMAMAEGEMPSSSKLVTLQRSAQASQRELADVLAEEGSASHIRSMGLDKLALDSVSEGMALGLSPRARNPVTGQDSGSLLLPRSRDADRLAARELRKVADGKMRGGGSVLSLVDAGQ
eukprot:763486-Hanusia_phi.AAC.2